MNQMGRPVSRPFLSFFGANSTAWAILWLGALTERVWAGFLGMIAIIGVVFIVAVYHWRGAPASPFAAASRYRRSASSPFSKAVAGLLASGVVVYAVIWILTIAPYSCEPDDFDCLTVGSQWVESLFFVVVFTVAPIASAALGALVGFRFLPWVSGSRDARLR